MINGEAIKKIEELVQAIQEPVVPPAASATSPQPFVVVPDGWNVKPIEVPSKPSRIAQKIALHDAASFAEYVKQFATETTAILFEEDQRRFTAVLDYHGGGQGHAVGARPEWCEHVATFVARTTPEWDTWLARNQKPFGQVEFAEFLEDNLLEVVQPSGADLLEITKTLEAKKDVAYSSALRLNNGSFRLHFDETIRGTANTQAGVIDIPEQFTLQIQVIRGGSVFKFPARFKYRLKDRALVLWYEIVRPHKILEQALDETVKSIADGTAVPIRKGVITTTAK